VPEQTGRRSPVLGGVLLAAAMLAMAAAAIYFALGGG
jgi:hypothetical protein